MAERDKICFNKKINTHLRSLSSVSPGVKKIFLWELLFNASQALLKIRYESLVDKTKLGAKQELFIHIVPDKSNNTLSIIDTGIGMTEKDLLCELGTISSERKEKYLSTIEKFKQRAAGLGIYVSPILKYKKRKIAGISGSDLPIRCINKEVGLGFYSAFLVAEKVVVTTKHNDDEQYVWESHGVVNGGGSFTIARDGDNNSLGRGTKVTLFLKDGHDEYLDEDRLKDMVGQYSDLLKFPILVGNEAPKKPIVVDKKEKKEELKKMSEQFEHLGKHFKKMLGRRVKRVIVSDRYPELACWLSLHRTLSINPKNPVMEDLRMRVEANKKDRFVTGMIFLQFGMCCRNIWLYDYKYGTYYMEKSNRPC